MCEHEKPSSLWIYPTSTHIQLSLLPLPGRRDFLLGVAGTGAVAPAAVAPSMDIRHLFMIRSLPARAVFHPASARFASGLASARGEALHSVLYTDHDEKWIIRLPPFVRICLFPSSDHNVSQCNCERLVCGC